MNGEHFDAVVVGSGFGGSVMAYRLAEAGLRVCLLERGKAYPPDSFPRSPYRMRENFWDPSEGLHGLYDFWSFHRIHAVVASGLGGGSLVYANVLMRKDEEWFVKEDLARGGYEHWPVTRADLDPHYDAGDHIVTDLTRGIVAAGRITRSLDLRDLNKVYPLVTIPEWVAGRFFYDLLGRVVTYLLLPLIVGYAVYWVLEYLLTVAQDSTVSSLQTLLAEIATDVGLLVIAFGLFFLAVRRTAARAMASVSSRLPGHRQGVPAPHFPEQEIRDLLATDRRPPMDRDLPGREIDVFVSGHTHAPSLSEIRRDNGDAAIIVNSGCWLRQLQPIRAHFRGPPVFAPKFVLTHVRVFFGDSGLRAELWEQPKPARVRLRAAERIAILGRLPVQPDEDAKPRVRASGEL